MNSMEATENTDNKFGFGIRGRLFIGFFAILLILVCAISLVVFKITTAQTTAQQVIDAELPAYDAWLDVNGQLYEAKSALQGWLLTHEPRYRTDFVRAWGNVDRALNTLDNISGTWPADYQDAFKTVKPLIAKIRQTETSIMNPTTSLLNTTSVFTEQLEPQIDRVLEVLDGSLTASGDRAGGVYDKQYERLSNGTQKIMSNMNTIRLTEYILLIVGTLFSSIIIFITARSILLPLNNAVYIAKSIASGKRNIDIQVTSMDEMGKLLSAFRSMQAAIQENEEKLKQSELQTRELLDNILKTANLFSEHSAKVANGDLTSRIDLATNGTQEMSGLGKDLNVMTDCLAGITTQITEACHLMVGTFEEVRHAVDAQSSGASEQASSINQITASLEEIEKSSAQTIDKAKTLGEIAERTQKKGQLGLEAVEESIRGMKAVRDRVEAIAQTILDLSNQTRQVGEITSVVNTLAQQSKMLALNASIEAAKAGEAGKGFAVVAAEVKNLAEQSEQSTAQVQKILEDISHATEKAVIATEEGTKGVDQGSTLVEQTGEIVRSLSEVIHETTIASQQIEAAIRQEGVGIEQITAGMNEINQVTSSFVTSVTQTTKAIDNLSGIAKNLKEHVDVYRV